MIKFSIWQGLSQYEKKEYVFAIPHLERVVKMYPKSIGRHHMILGIMYLETGDKYKALKHALKAQAINPQHDAPVELLQKINVLNAE